MSVLLSSSFPVTISLMLVDRYFAGVELLLRKVFNLPIGSTVTKKHLFQSANVWRSITLEVWSYFAEGKTSCVPKAIPPKLAGCGEG